MVVSAKAWLRWRSGSGQMRVELDSARRRFLYGVSRGRIGSRDCVRDCGRCEVV